MEERNGSKIPHKMDTIRRRGSQEWTQEEEKYILWNENDKKKGSQEWTQEEVKYNLWNGNDKKKGPQKWT